jgi:lysophospholipase L1-like esterase
MAPHRFGFDDSNDAHKFMQQLKWHDSLTQIWGPTNESRPECSFPQSLEYRGVFIGA